MSVRHSPQVDAKSKTQRKKSYTQIIVVKLLYFVRRNYSIDEYKNRLND